MSEQREVVILSGVRTAIGDYGGSLKDIAPSDLAARAQLGKCLLMRNRDIAGGTGIAKEACDRSEFP